MERQSGAAGDANSPQAVVLSPESEQLAEDVSPNRYDLKNCSSDHV